jgi:D-3-phosphoglycerate dehydrogenase
VVRSNTHVDQQLVNQLPNLRCVISATHGMDHVDQDYLTARGIAFVTVPVQSYDVAQGVIAYILAHATNLLPADRSMKQEQWRKRALVGCRITNKTLGIIGYGKIGKALAHLASVLGMTVLVYDPYIDPSAIDATSVPALDALLGQSDYLSIHVPLTEQTRGMIGRREITQMKDGAFLINTARGGIVDEHALLDAIDSGKLSGAGLDVFVHQHPFYDEISRQLVHSPHVLATPHSIGQTHEALRSKGDAVMKIIHDLFSNELEAQ